MIYYKDSSDTEGVRCQKDALPQRITQLQQVEISLIFSPAIGSICRQRGRVHFPRSTRFRGAHQ